MGRSADKQTVLAEAPVPVALPEQPPVDQGASNEKAGWLLSFGQQRLWFLDRLEPESALYNMPCLLRVSGPLSVEALKRAV